jgi:hypothetical protein
LQFPSISLNTNPTLSQAPGFYTRVSSSFGYLNKAVSAATAHIQLDGTVLLSRSSMPSILFEDTDLLVTTTDAASVSHLKARTSPPAFACAAELLWWLPGCRASATVPTARRFPS